MSDAAAQSQNNNQVRLADFIRLNLEEIIVEWVAFAKTLTPASDNMTKLALRDHIEEILNFIADDLETFQTEKERFAKSRGLGPDESPVSRSVAEVHASLRLIDGFNIDQMVSEYRALRASVVKQWTARQPQLVDTDLDDLTRFNESIDQAVAESVAHYTKEIEHSRNLFLGVLGHDLRNPIGAASMLAKMMVRSGELGGKMGKYATQIVGSTDRATQILDDLLDITRSAFGSEIPIERQPMDLRDLAERLVQEMRALSDRRSIELSVTGDTEGDWDGPRLGQVFSNLIGNALQHSSAATPVRVSVAGEGSEVHLTVQNEGKPIPPEKLRTLFGRGRLGGQIEAAGSTHLGLGLFITQKIVTAHGGDVSVTSNEDSGTAFKVVLPRH